MAAIESVEDLAQEVQQELARLEAQIDSGAVSDVALLLAKAADDGKALLNPCAHVRKFGAQHAVAVYVNHEYGHFGIKTTTARRVLGSHNLIKKMDMACSQDPVVRARTTAPDTIPDPVEAAECPLWLLRKAYIEPTPQRARMVLGVNQALFDKFVQNQALTTTDEWTFATEIATAANNKLWWPQKKKIRDAWLDTKSVKGQALLQFKQIFRKKMAAVEDRATDDPVRRSPAGPELAAPHRPATSGPSSSDPAYVAFGPQGAPYVARPEPGIPAPPGIPPAPACEP